MLDIIPQVYTRANTNNSEVGPGTALRLKNFTTHLPSASFTYKRPQGKKADGKFFVALLLGVDNGQNQPDALDPDAFLKAAGWASPQELGSLLGMLFKLERKGKFPTPESKADTYRGCPDCRTEAYSGIPMQHKDTCALGSLLKRYVNPNPPVESSL